MGRDLLFAARSPLPGPQSLPVAQLAERYEGEHPPEVEKMMDDISSGRSTRPQEQ